MLIHILFSYSSKGLQRQLDILQGFCAKRGLKVNVQKTKTMVFEHQKSQTPAFTYEGSDIEQVENFKVPGNDHGIHSKSDPGH